LNLQAGMNAILNSQGYKQIPVTGKMDALTCAALGILTAFHMDALKASVDVEIATEAAATCRRAKENSVVNNQVNAHAKALRDTRNPTPAATAAPTPVVTEPATQQVPVQTAITTAPVPQQVVVEEEAAEAPQQASTVQYTPAVLTFPEMEVDARPTDKSYGKMPLLLGAVAVGAVYFLLTKK
jgi:hypothetical protein